jgi:hypothetical protein
MFSFVAGSGFQGLMSGFSGHSLTASRKPAADATSVSKYFPENVRRQFLENAFGLTTRTIFIRILQP